MTRTAVLLALTLLVGCVSLEGQGAAAPRLSESLLLDTPSFEPGAATTEAVALATPGYASSGTPGGLPHPTAAGGPESVAPWSTPEPVTSALQDAEDPPPDESDWEFMLRPYLWFASVSGTVTAQGSKSDADASFSDIWDALEIGLMFQLEAEKKDDDWGLILDTMYLQIAQDQKLAGSSKDLEAELTIFGTELDVYASVYKDVVQDLQVLGGARYYYMRVELDFPNATGRGTARQSEEWVDAILGLRYHLDFAEDWSTTLRGDMGGFGIGDSSDSYQGVATVQWHPGDNWDVIAGWRHLSVDYTKGSGANRFEADLDLTGPLLGFNYRF